MHSEENCRFAKTHEWAHMEGDIATVGISNHAQEEISDIVFVDLPKVGQQVTAGQNCCVIESVKSASEIYAPVSGEVVEVNTALANDPALVNREPHGNGWLFKIKMSAPAEYENLMDLSAYKATLGK
ncbi:glycine cleavage system protein GcvH [Candidatus Avelusimicrobium gallicola]|uniref:Glycine cleavage system H protein n=1 Tax=Candidatus Avelusimicrobium gallicola TaxID=2562704 RepID=A0A1Y4DLN4_9BACT|nr:glycine cleavage system protein GcvH [Elusimicrobium sp. An273]OUO56311.1 glycine cleavage system protein H [Elusimicrobium sp. An273]